MNHYKRDNTMPEKDPATYEALTYLWIILLSCWGGLSSYIRKIKKGHIRFSITEVIGEMCVSAFVGILTFFLCEYASIPPVLSAALIGISAHMGSRAIFMAETVTENIVKKWTKLDD